jgi:diguanylate cyclase (GGDEF)-like protein/PAS domain S-box-containing protein
VGQPSTLLMRALIVDDGERMAREISEILQGAGIALESRRVNTEQEFRAALLDPWDVIISDYRMACFEASRALWILGQTQQDAAVIVIADDLVPAEIVALVKAGAHDVVMRTGLAQLPAAVAREVAAVRERATAREAAHRTREEESRFRMLVEELPALTYIAWADEVRSPAYVSPQLRHMLGFTPTEWLSQRDSWMRQIHAEDADWVMEAFRSTRAQGTSFTAEYRILDREGRIRWWHDECQPFSSGGRAPLVRGFVMDVTERKAAEETIQFMRSHDGLTGLPNRVLLRDRLDRCIRDAVDRERGMGLLLLSLDGFREVINTLGQHNGDVILRQLSERLADVVGDGDRVARLRGDEFAIILPGADEPFARGVAAMVEKALQHPFIVERLPIEIHGSIGIAIRDVSTRDAETLLRQADLATQMAKREGGGCVVFTPACDPYDPSRLALLGELRHAIEADELLLHYQPKIDLLHRRLFGVEALVRWRHPRHGMILPDQFVPLAEKGGLIKPLTHWVLRRAIQECRTWVNGAGTIPVAVNLSAKNLHDPTLVGQVVDLLESSDLGPERLNLEVTETTVMSDPSRATEVLQRVRDWGVELSIDDFGTGYSSLAYLHMLPVSELKIDRSFVTGMGAGEGRNACIVESTSSLGHSLRLRVVAEGVEDAATLDHLAHLGCDGAQGFHIARPMPAPDLMAWLKASPGQRPA